MEFYTTIQQVTSEADLCFVMGTALAVAPVNKLPQMIGPNVPKVLFNLTNTKETGGYDFEEKTNSKLFVQGKCDETLAKLVEDCGWGEDFMKVLPDYH